MWKILIFAAFSIFWATRAIEEFDEFEKKHSTGCNSTINVNNSAFSLNYHNLSKPCLWNITPPGIVRLFFTNIFLHESDKLTLYRNYIDAVNGTNPLMEKPIPSQNGTITVITNEPVIVIKLVGGEDPEYSRIFEGFYSTDVCTLPVPPEVETLYSPIYLKDVPEKVECLYHFNEIPHKRVKQAFTFEEFNMLSSTVEIEGGTFSGQYKKDTGTDFFMDVNKNLLTIYVKQELNSTDYFKLKIHEVDSSCSGRYEMSETQKTFTSPKYELNNGSIIYECWWLVQHKISTNILGLKLDKVNFHSVFDIAAVNDGASKVSLPLLQVTTSNKNDTQNQMIRTSGSSLWIAFKPVSYESEFVFNVTVHGQGGYLRDSGEIKMQSTTGDDTAFLLEVATGKIVLLTFDSSSVTPPAKVSVYDGFDTTNLLTTIHGEIHFPVISRSSRMMITGTNFSAASNHFSGRFRGVTPDCNHMSSLSTENYILSENCNSTCSWIIPPQDSVESALVVYLQYISLKMNDSLKIHKLDSHLTKLAEITTNVTHVPHFIVPADVGILINVTQSHCKKNTDKIILIGHSSYIPACNHMIIPKPSERFQISSPLYPDTYPVFSNCQWNITASKESIVHIAFQNLNLAKNHCVKVSEQSGKPSIFEGKTLPDDLFLSGNVLVGFDSSGCNKGEVGKTLESDSGFLLNVTVADCGAVLNGEKDGEFNTSISGDKDVCIWKVSVPPNEDTSVNIISYTVNKKDSLKNYELHVYDGSTVRESEIENNTDSGIWSRTNTLIFIYRRLNISQSSSVLFIKYKTVSCNDTMQCENKICMHPDWRCNGKNECGDFTDERNCASVPIPPEVKYTGYSDAGFWSCAFAMLIIGAILGITVPVLFRHYRDSRYRRFQDLDG